MKTSLYLHDSTLQVVLTPETKEEQAAVDLVEKKDIVEKYRGAFFDCRGGWMRFRPYTQEGQGQFDYSGTRQDDDSLIFVLKEQAPPPDPVAPAAQIGLTVEDYQVIYEALGIASKKYPSEQSPKGQRFRGVIAAIDLMQFKGERP